MSTAREVRMAVEDLAPASGSTELRLKALNYLIIECEDLRAELEGEVQSHSAKQALLRLGTALRLAAYEAGMALGYESNP